MEFPKRTFVGLNKILNDISTRLQSALLPSGAIIWFNRTSAPSGWVVCDGTNGTPNLIDKYPLGATSGIGSIVAAGLPNITGTFKAGNRTDVTPEGTGAFGINKKFLACANYGTAGKGAVYSFSASWSNSIYGRSTTVTPPSVKLLPCMKL